METITGTSVEHAAALLRSGSVVAIPTETVYGLAANAFNETAVLEIFRVKERPSFDPLIVHVGNKEHVRELAQDVPDVAFKLMEAFWPGPLTLVLQKKSSIPDLVTSGLNTFGVRMPSHPVALQLLNQLEFPLAAPSANPFGYISPTTAGHVHDQLNGKIPYILDGSVGVESTIIGFAENECVLYRYGGISVDAVRKITGTLKEMTSTPKQLPAPGMLTSHYAPGKPFKLGEIADLYSDEDAKQKTGIISFNNPEIHFTGDTVIEVLSKTGNLDEAARNLFAALRRLDASDVKRIIAEPVPDSGIGKAINDRLRRAAAEK
jgi:L-threonylcarbamoyladenylate synthase